MLCQRLRPRANAPARLRRADLRAREARAHAREDEVVARVRPALHPLIEAREGERLLELVLRVERRGIRPGQNAAPGPRRIHEVRLLEGNRRAEVLGREAIRPVPSV